MAKQVDSTNIGGLLEDLLTRIKNAFWRKSETSQLSIDDTPTSGSNNLVKSGGIYTAVSAKYTKPSDGIPATDIASGVIPDVSSFITESVNDLANYYLKSETYTQTEVNSLIGAISQFHYEIAASTSAVVSPASNVLYLIGPTGSGVDKYEEYVYPDSTTGWVKIGDTSIDLSGYATTSAMNTALAAKYEKPSGGIPESDLATAVTNKLNATEIFWATYGTTTFSAINTALGDNKVVLCKYGELVYVLTSCEESFFFSCPLGSSTYYLTVTSSNEWDNGSLKAELTQNKKTSVSANASSNTYYPTTKAVADYAQPIIDSTHKLDYSLIANTPTIPTEVFIVTYGTTTQSEILAAVAAGQLPVCKYGDNLYVYSGESSANYSQFTSVLYNIAYRIYIKNSTWGNATLTIPAEGIPSGGTTGQVLKKSSGTDYAVEWANESGAVTDVTVGGTSVVSSGVAVIPAIPSIEAMTNTEIDTAVNTAWV